LDATTPLEAASSPDERTLGTFLRTARIKIPPDTRSLGRVLRHPHRIAKPVTQEEVAESVGVSREWYARIELGKNRRVTPSLLERLAEVLMLDETRRDALFTLGIPELRSATLGAEAASAAQLRSLRTIIKRLWAATSEREITQTVLEFGQTLFRGTDLVMSHHHLGSARWEIPVLLGPDPVQRRLTDLAEIIMTRCDASEINQWFLHGVVTQPGDTVVFSDVLNELAVARTIPDLERQVNLAHSSVLVSHVRSRKGYEGNVVIGRAGARYDFSSSEVSIFSALADLASLALST
jgi:transcriptional regulator with XRE-family HTH domain